MKFNIKIIPILLFVFIIRIEANDTEMGNYGYNPVPMSASKVQMIREVIYAKMENNEYKVHCKFWFYNHGDKVKLKVGFPDYPMDELDENYQPLKNFRSLVNDKPVTLEYKRKIKRIDTSYIENNKLYLDTISVNWYIKTVDFPANDTVIIENCYEGNLGGTVGHWFSALIFMNYVIGTGSSWYGNISDGLIVFDYTNLRSADFIRNPQNLSKNKNITVTISENMTTFQFKDYKPKKNETLGLEFYSRLGVNNDWESIFNPPANESEFGLDEIKKSLKEIKNNFDPEKLDRMSKEVLVRGCLPLENKTDIEFFKQKPWYKPIKAINENTDDEFIIDESKSILKLKKYISKNKIKPIIKKIDEAELLKQMQIFKLK